MAGKTSPAPLSTPPALFLPRDMEHVRLLGRWAVFALVSGAIAGVVVHGVREILILLASLRETVPGGLIFALPAIGGMVNGLAVFRVDREARGDGMYTYIKISGDPAFRAGPRYVFLKILSTLATLGSGARGGLVGPLVAVNGAIGVLLARWIPLLAPFAGEESGRLRVPAVCGAAGAVGALLQAPLGGGIFAVEILFGGSLVYGALFPAILTSTAAFFVSGLLRGHYPSAVWSHLDAFGPADAASLVIVLATAVAAGLVGTLFVFVNKRLPFMLETWRIPNGLRPVIGGALCGAVGLILGRGVLYSGTDLFADRMPQLLEAAGVFAPLPLLTLLVGIGLAVCFTVGGSGSGGLTMPAMTLGVLSGAVVASLFSVPPADSLPFLIAGMTACLASSLNVPIAAAVISLEIFGAHSAYAAVLGSVIGYQIGRGHLMYRYLPPSPSTGESGKDRP